jgi:maltose alpha-D-glucosyltransferase / alpha-amylase
VSGFRMDAVPFLIARDGVNTTDPKPAFDYLRDLRALAQWRSGDVVLLAEANVDAETAKKYFGKDGDRLHMIFDFPVNQGLFYGLATGKTGFLRDALAASREIPDTAQWAHFLRNHDELSLDKLSDEQRQEVFEKFAPDEDMRIYDRGIRRRLAPMMEGDRRRIELANSLMLTLPGTPVMRYGDEIGMGENLSLEGRFSCRTPMQWSTEKNAGFSASDHPVRPVVSDGPFAYQRVNVAAQRVDPDSLLNWTERMLRMRKQLPEVGWGDFKILDTPTQTLAIRYEWERIVSLFVHNFSADSIELRLPADCVSQSAKPLVCLQTAKRSKPDDGTHVIKLGPYGYQWLRLGGLDDLIDNEGHR